MKNKKNVPDIRFKGFAEEWTQRKANTICSISTGKSNTQDKEDNGIYPFYVRSTIVERSNKYLFDEEAVLTAGDGVGTGKVFHYVNGRYNLHQRVYRMFNFNDVDGKYFYFYFMTNFYSRVMSMTAKSSVDSVRLDMIAEMKINLPSSIAEQMSIVNWLSEVDRLINTSQTKLDKLKNIKKACLEKMFPRNGSTTPELRFKGFADEWKEQQLGDCADIVGGGTPGTANSEYWDGDIDWYSPAEIGDKIFVDRSKRKITQLGLKESSAKVLPIGTVLFSSRAGIGSTAILAKEGATNQGFQSIIPHNGKLDTYFIFSRTRELKKYGETNGAGSTFIEISGKQMESMPIINPEIDEQKAIGIFFENLDRLTAKTEQQINKLKNIKKACLDKMFVNTEDKI